MMGRQILALLPRLCLSVLTIAVTLIGISPVRAQSPAPQPTEKKDRCLISGTVVALAGGIPLRKAHIRLQNNDDATRSVSVVTDGGGHFEIKSIDPGRYRLLISRVGYVTQEYGQRKPQDPGAILALRPAQEMKELVFRMTTAAVISGRILDEDGEPLPGVSVSAMRESYERGKRDLSMNMGSGSLAESNDLGEFRLYGLAPGRYFISAVYSSWARAGGDTPSDTQQTSTQGYARMYYPGTPDRNRANAITVKAGEEVPSVEMLMRQVVVYHVRGRVYNQITHRAGHDCLVLLSAKGRFQDFNQNYVQVEKQDGTFDLKEVLPGSYVVTGIWSDEGKTYTARVSVEVGNADVDGIGVMIGPGNAVHGRVIWEGKPSMEKDDLSVSLVPSDGVQFYENGARVNADNSFTVQNVGDGTYETSTYGQSKDCYLKDVQYAGSSAVEDGFTVGRGSAELEITLSSRGARLQGTVSDADGLPAPGVWVALVPDSEARQAKHRLYKSETTDQYGRFDLRGITPGDYFLFSWTEVEQGSWEDPGFIKPFIEKKQGEKVSVQEGDAKTVNLALIQTATNELPKE